MEKPLTYRDKSSTKSDGNVGDNSELIDCGDAVIFKESNFSLRKF